MGQCFIQPEEADSISFCCGLCSCAVSLGFVYLFELLWEWMEDSWRLDSRLFWPALGDATREAEEGGNESHTQKTETT